MALFVIASSLLLGLEPEALSMPEVQFCDRIGRLTDQLRTQMPLRIDDTTQLVGATVRCLSRTVTYNKSISTPLGSMGSDWRSNQQGAWTVIICENPAYRPMAELGWQFIQEIAFPGGEKVTMNAECRP